MINLANVDSERTKRYGQHGPLKPVGRQGQIPPGLDEFQTGIAVRRCTVMYRTDNYCIGYNGKTPAAEICNLVIKDLNNAA